MNRDIAEMLSALSEAGVEFLIGGAHAAAVHGHPRAPGDLVRPTAANAVRVMDGSPLIDLSLDDLSQPGIVFQMGLPPSRIDILTEVSGLGFGNAWERRSTVAIEGRPLPFVGRQDLIANKRAAARPKDLADVAALEEDEVG